MEGSNKGSQKGSNKGDLAKGIDQDKVNQKDNIVYID